MGIVFEAGFILPSVFVVVDDEDERAGETGRI
jgi:hypothetical protein